MGQKNTIELNGNTYDAITGALLGESRVKATPAKRAALRSQRGRTIDGFTRGHHQPAPTVIKPATPVSTPPSPRAANTPKPKKQTQSFHLDLSKQKPLDIAPRQPERPKTLMRHVVHKPKVQMKPAIKTAAPTEMMARPTSTITKPLEKKLSVTQVNPTRLTRSKQVARSHHIRRYNTKTNPEHTVLAATSATPRMARPTQHITHPLRTNARATTTSGRHAAAPIEAPVKKQQTAADIFEAALAHANSHEQTAPLGVRRQTARKRRFVNVMAGIGAFLLIGGFIGYLNLTNIEVRVASMRAGFHAELPGYKPSGYALNGGVESSEGRVAMNFRSGDSSYTITQEASDWNSTTLLDQTAAERGEPTQTIQSKGRTIYIYDDSNATWVNGGVRYQISGNAPLDTDELVSLATSM